MDARRLAAVVLLLAFGCQRPGPAAEEFPRREFRTWVVAPQGTAQPPPVHFAFAPPVDDYAGEFQRMTGELRLRDDLCLDGARGSFSVSIFDLTMGDADLDANVRNNVEMLEGGRFPASTFRLNSIEGKAACLRVGEPTAVTLHGGLKLKGVAIPLAVAGTIEPRRGEDGSIILQLTGKFIIENLRERFSIFGPGGENEPAGNRVTVEVDVMLRQISNSSAFGLPPWSPSPSPPRARPQGFVASWLSSCRPPRL